MAGLVLSESASPGCTELILQRPERRNALSVALVEELCAALDALQQDASQRVVILRGAGPVFCAGLDLQEAGDESLHRRSAAGIERALRLLADGPLVSIAAVQGGAYAGGAGLMAACDLVIAAEDARIAFPEARRGLLPALIGEVLRRRVREGDLRDLLLSGDAIAADRAREVGLVQRVVPADDLYAEAHRAARSVLAGGPETIRDTKRLIAHLFGHAGDEPARTMAEWHLAARHSDEAREGLQAFVERRKPSWHPEDCP